MKTKSHVFICFITLFSNIFSAEEQIENAVVIVGNNRTAGSISFESISDIVDQENADFTYSASFPGQRVVSIDTQFCATEDEHIQGDFTATQMFAPNSQNTVIFEWFPPSSMTTVANITIANSMTEALRKAFAILKPGGQLIIDNHPFFAFAMEKEIAIQMHSPFALVLGIAEYSQIYNALCSSEKSQTLSLFSTQAYLESVALIQKIFATDEATIVNTLRKLMENALNILQQKKINVLLKSIISNPMGYMFLWGYHAFSRSTIMGNCLKKIGFDTSESQVEFVNENPFNKRKWACLIHTVKPGIANSPTDSTGPSSATVA